MKLSVKNCIYQAIIHEKWLDIFYTNTKQEETHFSIGIKDIDIDKGALTCDIFNVFKDTNTLEGKNNIRLDGIRKAVVLEHSYYETPADLIEKVSKRKEYLDYLEIADFDNNILRYLEECYRKDEDPSIKEQIMVDGIDPEVLTKEINYPLDQKQFETFLNKIFKERPDRAEEINKYLTLAINVFSIDQNNKQYVVAYRTLRLNFKTKMLRISPNISINKSFLVAPDESISLTRYLDISPDEFAANFAANRDEYQEMIEQNFTRGEIPNTRPTIFFLQRKTSYGVSDACEAIHSMEVEGKLTTPLKSFFGRNRKHPSDKETDLVVFDRNKINIDQMRVIHNAMVNGVTYVKGPPGTGKTETIFNILLSAYANRKTVLVCSNNNHPVNDIFAKMADFLVYKNPMYDYEEKIIFPMLRLGNREEMGKALARIREIAALAKRRAKSNIQEGYTEASRKRSMARFAELKALLTSYETRLNLWEQIEELKHLRELCEIDQFDKTIDQQIQQRTEEMNAIEYVKDEDVMKFAVSASEDDNFCSWLHYSSLLHFKKLNGDDYAPLRTILEMENDDDAVTEFNKYVRNDENLRLLLAVFPVIITTNNSAEKLGGPHPSFDIVVMDEAGQCNIASSLISIVRGKNLVLIGDTNQLQPVTVIEPQINDELKALFNIKPEYDYIENSILSTMMRKDNNSKNILLRYHYRCGQKIASFVNQRFYQQQLKLLNEKPGSLEYWEVQNRSQAKKRNSYYEEAKAVVSVIQKNHYENVGIITPFVNQANLINDMLHEAGITDVIAGTVHNLQGSEKNTIIMSAALSLRTAKKTMDWIKNNHELINVAVTRAKERFVFVGDKQAIDAQSRGEENDIKVLSDYVHKNGDTIVPPSDAIISYDFSNDSENEKEFFATIRPYFTRRGAKFRVQRNVAVADVLKNAYPTDIKMIGRKEFDVVVELRSNPLGGRYHPVVVFELDGGEHVGSKRTAILDRQKEKICAKYNIKLLRIPNSAIKDYDMIIRLFEAFGGRGSSGEQYNQMSLLEEEE